MRLLMQRFDCANRDSEKVWVYVREAIPRIRQYWKDWEAYGRYLLRHTVYTAKSEGLPEFQEWIDLAEKVLFPSLKLGNNTLVRGALC